MCKLLKVVALGLIVITLTVGFKGLLVGGIAASMIANKKVTL